MITRAVVAGALLLGLVVGVGHDPAQATALPAVCAQERLANEQWRVDTSRLGSEGLVSLDGQQVRVRGDGATWAFPPSADQALVTRFHSLSWLVDALPRGVPVVDLVLEREAALPDPGYSAGFATLKEAGWSEGMTRLRMRTIACLYVATRDPRLIPVMDALVAATLDPYRYRGRPLNRVHNHGTLANIGLLEAARVFDRPEWRQAAVRRFEKDASSVFAPCGMSVEQSTTYHRLNVRLWQRSLARLGEELAFPIDMGSAVRSADLAISKLTRPDGVLEAIGTGNPIDLRAHPESDDESVPAEGDRQLLCLDRGWASNRSSWSDVATHYVLRFGAAPQFHGHEDRGALTWFTQGVPVFVDRGIYDRARGARWDWATSAAAHSTFGTDARTWTKPFRASYAPFGGADMYAVRVDQGDRWLQRTWTIPLTEGPGDTSLRVTDEGRVPRSVMWTQRWQLSEEWRLLERTTPWQPAAVHDATGLYLYGACSSDGVAIPQAVPVETFPSWRVAKAAVSLECSGIRRLMQMDTVWVVSRQEGLLTWDLKTGDYAVVPSPPIEPVDPLLPSE